ncbi:MAG: branched-chain amino acid ABC transporter permease [Microbacteriaceae bacterium]
MSQPTKSSGFAWPIAALGWPRPRPVILAAAAVVAIILPFIVPDASWLSVATLGAIWLTLNQSWNLVIGFAGVWNFGHLALYAVGAYTVALLRLHTDIPIVIAVLLGSVAAAAAGVLIAIPTLRLKGIYVALLTFAFAEVVRLLIISDQTRVTGGSYGLSGFEGFAIAGIETQSRAQIEYWIVLGVAMLTAVAMTAIVRSPLGSALQALRDNPSLAAARGVSPRTYQLVAFAISGAFAGLAGGLYAMVYEVVSPTLMGLMPMTLFVTMLVVGGLGTILGPIVGTVLITFVQARLQEWPELRLVVLGLVLLIMVVAMPRGVVPALARGFRRLTSWMDADQRG